MIDTAAIIQPTGSALRGNDVDNGFVTSATADTLTDSAQEWTSGEHAGRRVQSFSRGAKTVARIDANDQTSLTVGQWSNGVPDSGEKYVIYGTIIPFLILATDIAAARLLWKQDAPNQFKGLLDGSGGWKWDGHAQAYVSRHGHDVGGGDLKALSSTFAQQVEADMRSDASSMAAGITPLETWQRNMADSIKDLYICQGALAAGGFGNLTPAIVTAIAGDPGEPPGTSFSLSRLQGFTEDVEDEVQGVASEPAIIDRAALYADASRGTFENIKRISHMDARDPSGRLIYLFERNILGPTERHCRPGPFTDGCQQLTDQGWVPIGSMSLPGQRTCKMGCACSLEFSLTGDQHEHN